MGVTDVADGATVETPAGRPRRRPPPASVVVALALIFSVAAVVVSPLLGATNGSDPLDVRYGLPIAWVHQDQSALGPPHPSETWFVSPWERPTTFSAVAFLLDVVIVLAAVLSVLALLRRALRRRRTSRGS